MQKEPGAVGDDAKQLKASDAKLSFKDAAADQEIVGDSEHHGQQFGRIERQKPREDNVRLRQEKDKPKEPTIEQKQQRRDEEKKMRVRDDDDDQRQSERGRQRSSNARPSVVRLAQHPDCVKDVRKYCKGSNPNNFAVVECLQDDVEVSGHCLSVCYDTVIR